MVSVIFSTMLAICTGVSASEFNESIVSLLQTVVEGKFVMGPVGTDEVTPDVDEGKFVIGPVGTEEAVANVDEGKFVIGPEGTEGVGANVDRGADVGDDTLACVRGAGVNQATSATAAKVTGGSTRINFLTVRLLANFILCVVQYEFLRLNKVQIYLQRAQHDSGLMHERIVIGKRNIFEAIK